jgi:hypothetical protein
VVVDITGLLSVDKLTSTPPTELALANSRTMHVHSCACIVGKLSETFMSPSKQENRARNQQYHCAAASPRRDGSDGYDRNDHHYEDGWDTSVPHRRRRVLCGERSLVEDVEQRPNSLVTLPLVSARHYSIHVIVRPGYPRLSCLGIL